MEKSTGRRRISRFLHWIGEGTSRASAAGLVMVAVVAFMFILILMKFSSTWENTFSMAASAITLVMVFVIQHTQSRQQIATQLKLDELIRSAPRADDLLIHVESADDEELLAMDQEGMEQHSAIREGDDDEESEDGHPAGVGAT
jgi:low affinity Fe/Cu permease